MTGHGGNVTHRPPPDYPGEEDHPSLVWLKEQWESGNTKKIEDMVELWTFFEMLGKIGRGLRRMAILLGKVLVWLSGLAAAWWILVEQWHRYVPPGAK